MYAETAIFPHSHHLSKPQQGWAIIFEQRTDQRYVDSALQAVKELLECFGDQYCSPLVLFLFLIEDQLEKICVVFYTGMPYIQYLNYTCIQAYTYT